MKSEFLRIYFKDLYNNLKLLGKKQDLYDLFTSFQLPYYIFACIVTIYSFLVVINGATAGYGVHRQE